MNEPEEARLLEAARAGDAAALEALLAHYQPRIYRFGMKMCRRPEDAADVLQDTLLAMARGLRDFRGASSVSTWLYTIPRSYCIKKRRRSKFAPEHGLSLEAEVRQEVAGLADRAGLSVSRFKARFKEEVGIPPADYIQRSKIAASKKLLAEQRLTVTAIAHRLGFSTSQYFATVFKRYTGHSPVGWKRTVG